jgi:hypothetical protein
MIYIDGLKEKQSTHDLSLIIEWTITQVDWLSFTKDIREHQSFNIHLVNKWTSLTIYSTLSVIKFMYIL